MANATTKSDVRSYMAIDKYFRIKPVSLLAKDGSKRRFMIEHRVGDDGGTHTLAHLVDITGVEAEAVKEAMAAKKGIHNKKTAKRVYKTIIRDAHKKVRGWVKSYVAHLVEFYRPQGIKPVMRFVPEGDLKTRVVYIQGFIDLQTLTPVLGNIDAITLALEVRNAKLKNSVDEYRENQLVAKKALALPGINKDIQNRLNKLVSGSVDRLLLLERYKEEDEA